MRLAVLIIFLPFLAHAQETSFPDDVPLRALSLVGTSYRPGGDNPEHGFDCSGFVNHVYREAMGVLLPRDSTSLSRIGQALEKPELEPGDLVFFNTMKRAYSHVGIYLGENRFVHASSSRSGTVMLSSLTESYWASRFDGARRVITSTPHASE